MHRLAALTILVLLLLPLQRPVRAAVPQSDWPALNLDGAQSNDNTAETTLNAHNVLKLKVHWAAPIPDVSYPIVFGGRVYVPVLSHNRVHVRVLDAASGKVVATFPKDARGGMLGLGSSLYLAGHIVQEVDPSTGDKLSQISAKPAAPNGIFLDPVADQRVMVVGYAAMVKRKPVNRLYGINPQSNDILWTLPSMTAQAALGSGRVLTEIASGSGFYDEASGKRLARQPAVWSDWFAGSEFAYTAASIRRGKATLYAFDGSGHPAWKRVIGPYMVASGWPHAIAPDGLYVQTLSPRSGIVALDPVTGHVLWSRALPSIQRIVLANGLLFVLAYSLGQPARLIVLRAQTGAPLGAIVLSSGYFTFNEPNGLMVANGMVFIRAVGPANDQVLVALGLPGG